MKIFSFLLDLDLFYVSVLFASCIFLFSVFDIYYDRKKNLWHFSGPFPLPLVGKEGRLSVLWNVKMGFYLQRKCSVICEASRAIHANNEVSKYYLHLWNRGNVMTLWHPMNKYKWIMDLCGSDCDIIIHDDLTIRMTWHWALRYVLYLSHPHYLFA